MGVTIQGVLGVPKQVIKKRYRVHSTGSSQPLVGRNINRARGLRDCKPSVFHILCLSTAFAAEDTSGRGGFQESWEQRGPARCAEAPPWQVPLRSAIPVLLPCIDQRSLDCVHNCLCDGQSDRYNRNNPFMLLINDAPPINIPTRVFIIREVF